MKATPWFFAGKSLIRLLPVMAEQSASNAASANGMVKCMTGSKLPHPWLARRTTTFDGSGIRRIFDLAATMKDPVDLSIGQPHFEVPEAIQKTAVEAITTGKRIFRDCWNRTASAKT